MTTADQPYLERIDGLDFTPVFIMGSHRSGTTLLYDLLARTGCFNVVTVYHVLRYDELLSNHVEGRTDEAKRELVEQFEALGIIDRKIDRMQIGPDSMEEYGFFLRGGSKLRRRTLGRFLEACRKVQYTSDPTRPLLLKNPFDYDGNFMRVARMFPEARFVFIHRNPVGVINSRVKAGRVLFREKSEYSALLSRRYERLFERKLGLALMRSLVSQRMSLGFRLANARIGRSTRYYLRHVGELASSRYVWLRYEDLCAEPEPTVGRVMDFLGLEPRERPDLARHVAPRKLRLEPDVQRNLAAIARKQAAYIEAFGYPPPGSDPD